MWAYKDEIQGFLPEAPTPTVLPTPISADRDVLNCMLDTSCSGLFADGTVYKSSVADSQRYWINPAMDQTIQDVIRERVMPTVEEWTHGTWMEVENYYGETALRWEPEDYFEHGCGNGSSLWDGCSTRIGSSMAIVTIRLHNRQTGFRKQAETMYEIGLHEVLHALWDAEHTDAGLMCIADAGSCKERELRAGNLLVPLKERRPLDAQVYMLYGRPAIKQGMTADEVRALFGP